LLEPEPPHPAIAEVAATSASACKAISVVRLGDMAARELGVVGRKRNPERPCSPGGFATATIPHPTACVKDRGRFVSLYLPGRFATNCLRLSMSFTAGLRRISPRPVTALAARDHARYRPNASHNAK
jgi:hypothetical protein